MARSKSKHQRKRTKIRVAWKKRKDRKKAAAATAGSKKKSS